MTKFRFRLRPVLTGRARRASSRIGSRGAGRLAAGESSWYGLLMETPNIELTSEQKDLLTALSQETGKSPTALIEEALEGLREHLRPGQVSSEANGRHAKKTNEASAQAATTSDKPIWEKFIEASQEIPDEELDRLPTDLAAQVDHYIYGTPKR